MSVLVILIFLCFIRDSHIPLFFQGDLSNLAINIPATNLLPDSIAISCGSSGSLSTLDGHVWMGDSGFQSTFLLQINGKPSSSRPIHELTSFDYVPCNTARASRQTSSYVFQVKPGQKFIRLHFYQDSYKGFKRSEALFTVRAGPYTLLRNFSSSLAADDQGAKHIIKE
ncbi:hypothetical protein SASPL_131138 [Salvia splendens]|uniref:Uncharacterized protein n=1 Tax=Salvia splendens TaxID=180675 RepID=A0A8X8X5F1_SALSN|nr:hypothetical protein SASPL_131138 [Salvia splendens]